MRRRLLNLPTALSLLLCVAVASLWVRSEWASDSVSKQCDGRVYEIHSGAGGVGLTRLTNGQKRNGLRWSGYPPEYPSAIGSRATLAERLGFSTYEGTTIVGGLNRPPFPMWAVVVPYWSLFAATAAPALFACALSIRRRRRSRRLAAGLCSSCGYDLRATPERCPECGIVATKLA